MAGASKLKDSKESGSDSAGEFGSEMLGNGGGVDDLGSPSMVGGVNYRIILNVVSVTKTVS